MDAPLAFHLPIVAPDGVDSAALDFAGAGSGSGK